MIASISLWVELTGPIIVTISAVLVLTKETLLGKLRWGRQSTFMISSDELRGCHGHSVYLKHDEDHRGCNRYKRFHGNLEKIRISGA